MFKVIPGKKLCNAYRCSKPKGGKHKFCYKHQKRRLKELNLLRYTFDILRSNAGRRGKIFTITIEDFKQFCDDTGYLDTKGKTKRSMSIDCKIPSKGYSPGNIQIMSLSNNSKKGDTPPF